MNPRWSDTTVVLASHYHTPSAAVLQAFPVVLRAGHLRASSDYLIARRTSPGHDLLFCLAGEGAVKVLNRITRVKSGELVWINGYEPHAHWAAPSNPWELLWLRMEGPGLAAFHRLLGAAEEPVFCCKETKTIRLCFIEILRLMGGPAVSREAGCLVVLARLVAVLLRTRRSSGGASQRTIPKQIETVLNRIALYPHWSWTAADLARLSKMSIPRFYRDFRQITGSSPIEWVRRERINLAKRRLLESDDAIKTVADQAGYNSPFFFSRDFKRQTGQSPSEFRREERGG